MDIGNDVRAKLVAHSCVYMHTLQIFKDCLLCTSRLDHRPVLWAQKLEIMDSPSHWSLDSICGISVRI